MNSKQLENWADKLLLEYEEGRKDLGKTKNKLDPESLEDMQDKKQINSMINDMSFSIDWMKRGRRPGNLRGIDRRSVYQRRVLLDMELFPSLDIEPEQEKLSNESKEAIVDVLINLSVRERQCYILHNAYGMSMANIGTELNVSKSSVQKYINRANEKINKKILSYERHTVAN